ncbi:hypothetical protein QE177_08820 [Arsenophonus sp. aPb]|uniref:hypothetical protein n=1 Tax=Arsenophonus sp. aPb TaxID=3041619 RepID=UPI0024697287|nr:hypothetical protein [Arsenophonus sp. aPb]WGL97325.1 hypothetical protein QE177_08820 [Arsenophonus sp. aPb]
MILQEKYGNAVPKSKLACYLNKNFLFILALILLSHLYYGAITAPICQNIVNDNMLATNYWHKSGKVVIRKVCMHSLIK